MRALNRLRLLAAGMASILCGFAAETVHAQAAPTVCLRRLHRFAGASATLSPRRSPITR